LLSSFTIQNSDFTELFIRASPKSPNIVAQLAQVREAALFCQKKLVGTSPPALFFPLWFPANGNDILTPQSEKKTSKLVNNYLGT
jgi:hypothetical protein